MLYSAFLSSISTSRSFFWKCYLKNLWASSSVASSLQIDLTQVFCYLVFLFLLAGTTFWMSIEILSWCRSPFKSPSRRWLVVCHDCVIFTILVDITSGSFCNIDSSVVASITIFCTGVIFFNTLFTITYCAFHMIFIPIWPRGSMTIRYAFLGQFSLSFHYLHQVIYCLFDSSLEEHSKNDQHSYDMVRYG